MSPEKKHLCFGIMTVIGGILLHFTYGYYYTLANMTPYLLSYSKYKMGYVDERLKIWLSSLALVGQGLMMPLGGLGARKIGFRPILAISCLVDSASILVSYASIQNNFVGVLFTYGLLQGLGLGLGYSVVLQHAASFFPKQRALIVGLTVAGFGMGGIIFNPVQTAFINPNNEKVGADGFFTDPGVLDRTPKCLLLCGGCLLAVQIIGFVLLRDIPEKVIEEDYDDEKFVETIEEKVEPKTEINLGPKEVVRCLDFWFLCLIMCLLAVPVSIISAAYKVFGQQHIKDDQFLSAIATTASVFNTLGRVVWGAIADKISFKFPFCLLLGIWAAFLVTFPHLYHAGEAAFKVLYAIWVFIIWFCLSGVFVLVPAATTTLFGQQNMATNYGLIFLAFALGSVLSGLFNTFLPTQTAIEQFTGCFAVTFAALLVAIWLKDRKIPPRVDICRICSDQCIRCRGLEEEENELYT